MATKTCSKCGEAKPFTEFYKNNACRDGLYSRCKACHGESTKSWKERNADKVKLDNAKRKKENPPSSADHRRWVESMKAKDPEGFRRMKRASTKKWELANPEMAKASKVQREHRRRAKKRGNGVYQITPKDQRRLARMTCAHSHLSPCSGQLTIDHIVPIDPGGVHGIGNLQALCLKHNSAKGTKLEVEVRYEWSRRVSSPE